MGQRLNGLSHGELDRARQALNRMYMPSVILQRYFVPFYNRKWELKQLDRDLRDV